MSGPCRLDSSRPPMLRTCATCVARAIHAIHAKHGRSWGGRRPPAGPQMPHRCLLVRHTTPCRGVDGDIGFAPTIVWPTVTARAKLGDEVIGRAGSAAAPIDIGG